MLCTRRTVATKVTFLWFYGVVFVQIIGAQQIFKCCNPQGSQRNYLTANLSENVTISSEDLISTNITENSNLLR